MYAVIRTGGKQYRVAPDDVLQIEKLDIGEGEVVEFDDVLMIGKDGEQPVIGTPAIEGARVSAEVVEQGRGEKIIVFKKKRRQNYRRKNGHRQHLTTVRVLEVLGSGEKGKKRAGESLGKAAKAKPGEGAGARSTKDDGGKPAAKAEPAKKNARKPAAEAKPQKAAGKSKAARFKKLDAPKGAPDDLKALPGVGAKLADKLNGYGIFHFSQLAVMSDDDVAQMDAALDLKGRAGRDDWVGAARKLMGETADQA